MNDLLASPVATWLTSGAIVTAASIGTTSWWERRKLNRTERSRAYAAFLSAQSKRWRAFNDRDGAAKVGDQASIDVAEARAQLARDEAYDAYAVIQVLGTAKVVVAALAYLRLLDKRNRSFKTNKATPGVGADERANALASFVTAARGDVGLRELDRSQLLPMNEGL